MLVGLELVAEGGAKVPSLPVTWTKPLTTAQAREVANQARIFSCTAAISLATDVFDNFLRNIANEDWLEFDPDVQEIATKAKTRPKNAGGDYSIAERTMALFNDLGLEIGPTVAGIELLSKWRNRLVHSSRQNGKIDEGLKKCMIKEKEYFYKHYSHLDIELALKNFNERKTPVPKEATSLIAITQNVSRALDQAAIKRVAGTSNQVINVADQLLTAYFADDQRKPSAWMEISDIWQGSMERRRKNLLKVMQRIGLTETRTGISATLPEYYFENILSLTKDEIANRFGLNK